MYTLQFHLQITPANESRRVLARINGQPLDPGPSQAIRNHSPDGFEYGYGGSGPAQLALAICLFAFGNAFKAQAVYQDFKQLYVAAWPQGEPVDVQLDLTDFMLDRLDRLHEATTREQEDDDIIGNDLLESAYTLLHPEEEPVPDRSTRQRPLPKARYQPGDVVQVLRPFFGEAPLTEAIVYHVDESGYIYLLNANGIDLGAFGEDQQDETMLTFVRSTPDFSYDFRSVSYLEQDIRKGVFKGHFQC